MFFTCDAVPGAVHRLLLNADVYLQWSEHHLRSLDADFGDFARGRRFRFIVALLHRDEPTSPASCSLREVGWQRLTLLQLQAPDMDGSRTEGECSFTGIAAKSFS